MAVLSRLALFALVSTLVIAGAGMAHSDDVQVRTPENPNVVTAAKEFAKTIAGGDEALYERTLLQSLSLASSVQQVGSPGTELEFAL